MATLILLAGIAVLLFAMQEAHNSKVSKPSQEYTASEAISTGVTENDTIRVSLLSIPETSIPVTGSLSDDQDHDGNYDGIAEALIVLCGFLVVLGVYLVLLMPSVGRLVLRLCELLILFSSDYYLALEHPG